MPASPATPPPTACGAWIGRSRPSRLIGPDQVRRNLDAILARLTDLTIPALICGMRAPPWFGLYAVAFDGIFADVARRHGAALDPFLLEGVALNPAFALPDRIHPNAEGVRRIARRLAPRVVEALRVEPRVRCT